MAFDPIDPVLFAWAAARDLHIHTEYQGSEVRSIDVVDGTGRRCQLWIDAPGADRLVGIRAWDYDHRRYDDQAPIDELSARLDRALSEVAGWAGPGSDP